MLDSVSPTNSAATLGSGSVFGRVPLTWLLAGRGGAVPSRVLVLFDVSGSMRGDGIASALPAVGYFLANLRQDSLEVAIAPFESHEVAQRIRSATFGTPRNAIRSLDRLPRPGGNTALYSAIAEGVRRLADGGQRKALHLIVVTDGVNDIRSGDDQGLLNGASGLETAVQSAAQASVQVWTIGVGTAPDRGELTTLCGREDCALVVATDPLALSRALGRIGARIGSNTLLVLGSSAPPALALGASPRHLRAIVQDQDAAPKVVIGEWKPPLLAPPIAAKILPQPEVEEAARTAGSAQGIAWWRWALLSLPLGVVLLAAVPVVASLEVAQPTSPSPSLPTNPTGLRSGVKEARPRSPDEVTASRAERVVRIPDAR